jgi:hypothetical protein
MKIQQLFEENSSKSLLGCTINNRVVTENTPHETFQGDFIVPQHVTSLKYSPKHVNGCYRCSNTEITTLEFAPAHVQGDFACTGTKITSLEFAPSFIAGAASFDGLTITSLEHCPSEIRGIYLSFSECENLTSLHDIHKIVKQGPQALYLIGTPIKSHILGVLLIPNLVHVFMDVM